MNERSADKFQDDRWIYGLMGIFLFGMIVVTVSAVLDSGNRSNLEKIIEPTAAGDDVTVGSDPRQNPGREVLRWKQKPYFLESSDSMKIRESEVIKLAKDDTGKIQIYRQDTEANPNVVLVKIGAGEFVKLVHR